MRSSKLHQTRTYLLGYMLVGLLAACGGGGGDPAATPTAIPESLAVTAAASAEAGAELQFGSAASSLSGLTFAWDFGDGQTSADPSPKHSFAKGGDYEVVLKVSNSAGSNREQKVTVSVNNLSNVKGLVCSGAGSAGWCWQQPRPTGNVRIDLAFVDARTAVSVGENGEIFRTSDAGASWTQVASGVTSSLRAVGFSSSLDGWIVGDYGALLRSSDGGATWSLSKVDVPSYYVGPGSLMALDTNTAVLGNGSDVRYTTDGGQTWNSSYMRPTLTTPKGVFWALSYEGVLTKSTDFGRSVISIQRFSEPGYSRYSSTMKVFDEQVVLVCTVYYRYDSSTSSSSYKTVLMRSDDGGVSWTSMEPAAIAYGASVNWYLPQFLRASASDKTVVAELGSQIYRSDDGGSSWRKVGSLQSYSPSFGETLAVGAETLLVPGYGVVHRSEDLGQSWTTVAIASARSATLSRLQRTDANLISVRSSDGGVYVSKDQGRTWQQLVGGGASQAGAYVGGGFVSGKRGYLLSRQGELVETTDGGQTWRTKVSGLVQGEGDLQFYGEKLAWMLLGDGRWSKSTDGGASWSSTVTIGPYGSGRIGLVDDKLGWVASRYSSSAAAFSVTADGGQTWAEMAAPSGARALHILGQQLLIVYGDSGLLAKSSDGGKTWSQRYAGTQATLYAMAAQQADALWVVGDQGVVRRSVDQGQTWTAIDLGTSGRLNAIAFANSKVGWIVGMGGAIYVTTDGGKNWRRQISGTQRNLTRILVADPKTAWILGEGGTVLATGTGGF